MRLVFQPPLRPKGVERALLAGRQAAFAQDIAADLTVRAFVVSGR